VFGLSGMRRIVIGRKGKFGHFWGGRPLHEIVGENPLGRPLHLLLCLDMKDPDATFGPPYRPSFEPEEVQPGRLKLDAWSGLRWLPIYYPLPRADHEDEDGFIGDSVYEDIQYTVASNNTITGLVSHERDHGTAGYATDVRAPEHLPRRDVCLEWLPYEEAKIVTWAACVESKAELSPEDQQVAEKWGPPFHQWGGWFDLYNGPPRHYCANPDCKAYEEGEMWVVGKIVNTIADDEWLFSKPEGNWPESGRFIIEVCQLCASVAVTAELTAAL